MEKQLRVLDELLIAHKEYLPQFDNKITQLLEEGCTIKDEVVLELNNQSSYLFIKIKSIDLNPH